MKNNQITPAQFVKDNLPEYEKRLNQARFDYGEAHCWELEPDPNFNFDWAISVFSEALENFRQTVWREACEMMREQCVDAIGNGDRNGVAYAVSLRAKLYNLHIPELPKNE